MIGRIKYVPFYSIGDNRGAVGHAALQLHSTIVSYALNPVTYKEAQ